MAHGRSSVTIAVLIFLLLIEGVFLQKVSAQVVLDGTLGPAGHLTGPNYAITGNLGRQAGANLFHSFSSFSIYRNESATFSGPSTIQNIISRVTGGNLSYIDGLLRSTIQGANMFFVNPAGVMFGPNASLDVSGSFHVTTADYLKLGQSGRFDATNPGDSVLNSDPPSAFGFLRPNPAGISFDGSFLGVPEGKTLSVVGGDLSIKNANLQAPWGTINLVSMGSPGEATFNGASFDVDAVQGLGTISIADGRPMEERPRYDANPDSPPFGNLDTSGEGGGHIFIRGGRFIVDGGLIFAMTFGDTTSKGIDMMAREQIILSNGSYVKTDVMGSGKGGPITVTSPYFLADNSEISTGTEGAGNAGDVMLHAAVVDLRNEAWITTDTVGSGRGGNVTLIATESVTMSNSYVTSVSGSSGNSGFIRIITPLLQMDSGALRTLAAKTGDSGNITLDVGSIHLDHGAWVETDTYESGKAGNISINAPGSIMISGGTGLRPSIISSNTFRDGAAGVISMNTPNLVLDGGRIESNAEWVGNAGEIMLSVGTLLLANGAWIKTDTFDQGKGGNITIAARESVSIDPGIIPPDCYGTRISSSTSSSGTGGAINITTPVLIIDGGRIETKTSGTGSAGSILITTNNLKMRSGASLSAESTGTGPAGNIVIHGTGTIRLDHSSVTTATENADGGNITIDPWLIDLTGSSITATVKGGTGNGGNIGLAADNIILDGSRIIANAEYGGGGSINITSTLFLKSPDSIVSASSRFGVQGNVEISAPYMDIGSSIVDLPETVLNIEGLLPKACVENETEISSFVVKARDGLPLQPDGMLTSPYPYTTLANTHMEQMADVLKRGDFQGAISRGLGAEQAYGELNMSGEQVKTLLYLSSAYESLGHYREAMHCLHKAMGIARESGKREQIPLVLSRLGNGYLFINQLKEAEKSLNDALVLARAEKDINLTASTLNDLGNLCVLQKKHKEALGAYKEGLGISVNTGHHLLAARVAANIARALLLKGSPGEAGSFLDAAYRKHSALPDSHDKAFGLTGIGRMYHTLSLLSADGGHNLRYPAVTVFKDAIAVAANVGDHLSVSYASGYLGAAYENEKSYSNALDHTRRALFEAQMAGAPESIYLWHWQTGRLMEAMGESNQALTAYRKAVYTLQSIRYEFSGDCRVYSQVSYKDSIEPVYLGLVHLLLTYADSLKDSKKAEPFILEAIQNIELMRTAELRDYFQNSCVSAKKVKIDRADLVSPRQAIVYFVPFHDRLEVLLGLPGGLVRFAVDVDMQRLTTEIREFRRKLEKRTSREYLVHGRKLYEWLIRPLEKELIRDKVDTIVFIPDGTLRTIPLAALYDGNDFLISRYAVATTPGLTLIDAYSSDRDKMEVLLAGLSESVQGFPALTYVPYELRTVKQFYKGRQLMDKDFTISEMRREIEGTPYGIVHVASHGEFSENALETYLLTWDGKMSMDELERFVGISRFRRSPVELLCLSACQSAATNDRAALGLAGLSVKAGVKSALATLWYINDQASSSLVVEFYRHLSDRSLSKAKALQRAQMVLLKDDRYRHPCYWAPFLLIGNWL